MKLSIRQADLTSPRDSAAIVTVLDSYARDVMGGGEPLRPDVRARLPHALREHPTTVAFLASDAAEPVGVAICFVGFSTFHARPLLNIHDLAVVPDRRGQGIGRALLQAAEAEARRRGCCKLTLEVRDDNVRARRLYDGFGFTDFVVAQTTAPTRFLAKALDDPDGRERPVLGVRTVFHYTIQRLAQPAVHQERRHVEAGHARSGCGRRRLPAPIAVGR